MKKNKELSSLSSDELYEMLKDKKKNTRKKSTSSLTEKKKKANKEKEESKDVIIHVEEKKQQTVEEKKEYKSAKAIVTKNKDVDNTIVKKILSGEYIYFDDVDKEYEKINHEDDFEGFVDVNTHDITKVVSEARFNSDYHESLVDDDEFGTVRMGRRIDDSRVIDKSLDNGKWYKDIDATREIEPIIPVNVSKKKRYRIRWSAVIVTIIFILLFIAALIFIVWI